MLQAGIALLQHGSFADQLQAPVAYNFNYWMGHQVKAESKSMEDRS
jgi:hypothetical protein